MIANSKLNHVPHRCRSPCSRVLLALRDGQSDESCRDAVRKRARASSSPLRSDRGRHPSYRRFIAFDFRSDSLRSLTTALGRESLRAGLSSGHRIDFRDCAVQVSAKLPRFGTGLCTSKELL